MSSRRERIAELEADALRTRRALAEDAAQLAGRLEPGALLATLFGRAREAAAAELGIATRQAGAWVRANALLLAGLAATLGAVAALGHGVTRRRILHAHEAYQTEDPTMHEIEGDAPRTWDRVREGAEELGQRAGETYYHARSRAAELGAVARERAALATDTASEAAHRAADWTKRQPQENPMTSVIVGFALGAILAALMPRGRRDGA